MARVNIEECWWIDPRRSALIRLTGSEESADGAAIKAWRLAQEFWKNDRGMVPKYLFDLLLHAELLLKVNLAEIREDMVYIRGSSAYLDWVHEEREARKLGGQNSAKRDRDEKGRLLPKESSNNPADIQVESSCDPAESSSVQVSVSASASVSGSVSKKESIGGTAVAVAAESGNLPEEIQPGVPVPKKSKFSDGTRKKMQAFIAAYAKGYREKYQGAPEGIRQKEIIGKLGHWIEHVSEVRAISLVEVYLQISYRPFDENYHDLWQFFRHLNRIGVALDTGKDANTTDWSQVFAGAS